MTTATIQRSGRAELRLGAVLLALTAAAWALSADRMAGMDAAPGGRHGKPLRDEEVAAVPVGHVDDVPGGAELVDLALQDDLHRVL